MSSSGLDSWGNRPKPSEWFGNLPKVIDGSAGKESACSAGDRRDTSSIPGLGRSPGGEHGNPLQYSCWRIPWTEKPDGLESIGLQSQT